MCGILGFTIKDRSKLPDEDYRRMADYLLILSESRGKEASGIALLQNDRIEVFKKTSPACDLIKCDKYKKIFSYTDPNPDDETGKFITFIGHTRLVTNGSYGLNINNQPVIKDGLVGVHNGIIVNDTELWQEHNQLKRLYEVDTEVFLSLYRNFKDQGDNDAAGLNKVYSQIQGSASVAILFSEKNELVLATNTGSIYYGYNNNNDLVIFSSEKYILEQLSRKSFLKNFGALIIRQLKANFGLVINLEDGKFMKFSLSDASPVIPVSAKLKDKIIDDHSEYSANSDMPMAPSILSAENYKMIFGDIEKNITAINLIRRCKKCILPETMPYIKFDADGVCNYCRGYQKTRPKGLVALEELLADNRSRNGDPDSILAFSGGRDSSITLHYLKKVLKMTPIAYTYDWGMITDLGRRNQARMCGRLGVDHILVSADIRKKRANIKKNILAWLRKPDLATVPLFMAGDKQYFYYANKLKQQTKIKISFLGSNLFEKTDFKWGFCGIKPRPEKNYQLFFKDKIKLAAYYGRSYLINPSYINSTLLDTVSAYFSFYFIKHEHVNIFDYLHWDEKEINRILTEDYDWEIAKDTKSTWRIVDGTASFYNYIYYIVAGFTENDSLRSNQIREGYYAREEAILLAQEDNKPRFESIKWYCDTIGIDLAKTINRINSIPKLYENSSD